MACSIFLRKIAIYETTWHYNPTAHDLNPRTYLTYDTKKLTEYTHEAVLNVTSAEEKPEVTDCTFYCLQSIYKSSEQLP